MKALHDAPECITDGPHTFSQWIPNAAIEERTRDLAATMAEHFRGERVRLTAVLLGALPFHTLLVRELAAQPHGPAEIQTDALRVKSYEGTQSTGKLRWLQQPERSADDDVHVVLVEDIVDSGVTLNCLTEYLGDDGKSISTAVLLDKADARKIPFQPDWTGFVIPDVFVVGYGLDLAERHRDAPHVYAAVPASGHIPPYSLPAL